ncbi:outer membrane protein assembly factor BamE [Alcanivorax sp. REN37]|uniref:Outer membrane protein assembly factor BamE n=2 Tax=Isoalcanivorax beigongshangi TaxID=3238810 RepID=A0ABV4ADZ4_9GAMM
MMQRPYRFSTIVLCSLLGVTLLASGCSSLRFPGVYRIDIPQGNFVTEDMLSQLEPGMSAEQVRYVLGQPTLLDPFTPNAWYYPMVYQPGKGKKVSQRIVVHFSNGVYASHEGEVIDDFRSKVRGQQDRELDRRLREQQRNTTQADDEPDQRKPIVPPAQSPDGPGQQPGVQTR